MENGGRNERVTGGVRGLCVFIRERKEGKGGDIKGNHICKI